MIAHAAELVAQQQSGGAFRAFVLSGVLIAVVLVAVFVLAKWRKGLLGGDDDGASNDPMSLHTLRAMHERGELTDDEFERAKQAIIGSGPRGNPLREEVERRSREQGGCDG